MPFKCDMVGMVTSLKRYQDGDYITTTESREEGLCARLAFPIRLC